MIEETDARRAHAAFSRARAVGIARHQERDRCASKIEELLFTAKEQETLDTLVALAIHMLDR